MLCCLCLSSCEDKDYYKIDMNTDYKDTSNIEDGNGNKTKVVLLLGQSNASGCSYNDYLQKNITQYLEISQKNRTFATAIACS